MQHESEGASKLSKECREGERPHCKERSRDGAETAPRHYLHLSSLFIAQPMVSHRRAEQWPLLARRNEPSGAGSELRRRQPLGRRAEYLARA